MKLKLISGCLAIALVHITPSNAKSVSPGGHYTKKRGGPGEVWVQKAGAEWRILVNAAGIPRPRGRTAADCALIVVGTIERNTFQGEVKYELDASELEAQRKAVLWGASERSLVPQRYCDAAMHLAAFRHLRRLPSSWT